MFRLLFFLPLTIRSFTFWRFVLISRRFGIVNKIMSHDSIFLFSSPIQPVIVCAILPVTMWNSNSTCTLIERERSARWRQTLSRMLHYFQTLLLSTLEWKRQKTHKSWICCWEKRTKQQQRKYRKTWKREVRNINSFYTSSWTNKERISKSPTEVNEYLCWSSLSRYII